MNRHRTDAETEPLGQGITRINEYDFANCYLIEGEREACLIDTGDGICELSAVVRQLTDKPLRVLITHAHADHVGGAVWFPEVCIHPADLKTGKMYTEIFWRAYFLYCHRYKKKTHGVRYSDALQRTCRTRFKTYSEGDSFDLGGRTVEVFDTPGHSVGSVTLRDSLTGAVFAGDNLNPMVTLQYPYASTVKTWLKSAEKTLALAGDAPIYPGHGVGPVPRETVEKAISLAEEAIKKGNGPRRRTRELRLEEKYPRLLYKENRVL